MWHNRYITGVMHGVVLAPLTVARVALAGPVVKHDLPYQPEDGLQFSRYLSAGTASALARPPGYGHEQPLLKVSHHMVSPREGAA